jgi:hypothetical protein
MDNLYQQCYKPLIAVFASSIQLPFGKNYNRLIILVA